MEVFLNPLDLLSIVYPDTSIKESLESVRKEKAKLVRLDEPSVDQIEADL